MSSRNHKVLFVEDEPVYQSAFQQFVLNENLGYEVEFADSVVESLQILRSHSFDIVISDFLLSDGTATDLLANVHDAPVIVVTGAGDEIIASKIMKAGAADYLVKTVDQSHLNKLPPLIDRVIEDYSIKREDLRVQREMEESHRLLVSVFGQLRIGILMVDPNGCVTHASDTFRKFIGFSGKVGEETSWTKVCPWEPKAIEHIQRCLDSSTRRVGDRFITTFLGVNDQRVSVEIDIREDPRGGPGKVLYFYDVTEVHSLRELLMEKAQFHDLVGKSEAMQQVFQLVREVSAVDWPCLVEGETGTGKELVARAIHFEGSRKKGPFIPVNCAGLTDSLLTSQLFGHKRGAFTGAVSDHSGLFEAADRGSIFLDEIGDIPMAAQTNLLRVLQEGEVTRVGESKPRKVDVRVIAATNKNLESEVGNGNFRSDLLYRIRVARIMLPPLRNRREDIPLLAKRFMERCRVMTGNEVSDISQEALLALHAYDWPGNVRELNSAIEFATMRCKGSTLPEQLLPPEILNQSTSIRVPLPTNGGEQERIMSALDRSGGNRTAAARLLGMSRATFYRRLQEFGISRGQSD